MPAAPATNGNNAVQQAQQANAYARQLVLANAVEMTQQISSLTYTGGPGQTITVLFRPVGFVKKFLVEVQATISAGAGNQLTLSKLGSMNFFSNIILTDLSNQQRMNTTGWHLQAVQSAKYKFPYAGSMTATDTPLGFGNNFTKTQQAPAIINGVVAANNFSAMYEVPVTYGDADLRGGIFAGVVGATAQIQLQFNPNISVAGGQDATLACYSGVAASAAVLPSVTVTVYQVYLDQLPIGSQGPILPLLDMNVGYMFNNTAQAGLVTNQPIQILYANYRQFMSTTVIYDDAGTLTPNGTDITNWSIQTANLVNIFQVDVNIVSLWSRLMMDIDFPTGMYYFSHRSKPIATVVQGNMALVAQLSTANAGASLLIGWESLAQFNQITGAGSLYGV